MFYVQNGHIDILVWRVWFYTSINWTPRGLKRRYDIKVLANAWTWCFIYRSRISWLWSITINFFPYWLLLTTIFWSCDFLSFLSSTLSLQQGRHYFTGKNPLIHIFWLLVFYTQIDVYMKQNGSCNSIQTLLSSQRYHIQSDLIWEHGRLRHDVLAI